MPDSELVMKTKTGIFEKFPIDFKKIFCSAARSKQVLKKFATESDRNEEIELRYCSTKDRLNIDKDIDYMNMYIVIKVSVLTLVHGDRFFKQCNVNT